MTLDAGRPAPDFDLGKHIEHVNLGSGSDGALRAFIGSAASKLRDVAHALVKREIPLEFERIPLPVKRASYAKILNWVAVEAGIALRRTEAWGWPTHVQIEASSHCNLRCTYCPVGSETGTTGHMSPEVFAKLVDDVHRHALLIILWGWGEPFLCPSVYEMIDYVDRFLEDYSNYDRAEGFEDKTSSARWSLPPGVTYRLWEDKEPCSGDFLDLVGTGDLEEFENFDNFGFGDDASCSEWLGGPFADAGPDRVAECTFPLTPVTLDGTGSSDIQNDPLTFDWSARAPLTDP